MTDGLIVDRGRLTHRHSKRLALLQLEVQRAERDLDVERIAALLNELDAIMMSVVVALPEGWLPDGVTINDAGWIDYLTAQQVEEIGALVRAQSPGKKTA
jgi:hypothetical protein